MSSKATPPFKITQAAAYSCAAIAATLAGLHAFLTFAQCNFGNNGFYSKTWYKRTSAIVLVLIFIMSIIAHHFVQQNPDSDNPNTWADTLYTSSLSIIAVLLAITISASHADTPPAVCGKTYHYSKLALLVVLTIFTTWAAMDRKPA